MTYLTYFTVGTYEIAFLFPFLSVINCNVASFIFKFAPESCLGAPKSLYFAVIQTFYVLIRSITAFRVFKIISRFIVKI